MPDQQVKLREVAWKELFPWLLIVRCVRVAMQLRMLVFGALGLVAVTAGWQVLGSFYTDSEDPVVRAWLETGCRWIWHSESPFTILTDEAPNRAADLVRAASTGLFKAPIALWAHFTRPFVDLFDEKLTLPGFSCLFLCGVWELLVWSIVGGAMTRIAALSLTRRETPNFGQATKYALASMTSYFTAPLMTLAAAAIFALQLILYGLAMRVEILAVFAGLAWPFVLLLGLLMAIILIGLSVGWPMMWATISVEGTDAFDAVSRMYAYTYQRPLRLIWYALVAVLIGGLGLFVVKLFALAMIGLGDWSVSWGLDVETMQTVVAQSSERAVTGTAPAASGLLNLASNAIDFWKSLLSAVAAGYQVAFLWSATVAIYLLLRRDIDQAEMDQIFIEDEEPDFGMPPLEEDESGIPKVVNDAPAQSAEPSDDAT